MPEEQTIAGPMANPLRGRRAGGRCMAILCRLAALLSVAMLFFAAAPAIAAETTASPETAATTAATEPAEGKRKKIRVGFFAFDGYHMVDAEGKRSGYGYEVLQKMRLYENWNYEYVGYEQGYSWPDMLSLLEAGEIDLVTSATMTDERLQQFDYSSLPIGASSTRIVVRAGDGRYDTQDYADWNGVCVGLLSNNSRNDSFADYARKHGFSYNTVMAETQNELGDALRAGTVDMIVTSNLLKLDNVAIVDQFDEKPFYVIVKRGNTALLEQVNNALNQMQEDDPGYIEALYDKYYRSDGSGLITFTKKEQRYVSDCRSEGKVFYAIANPDRVPLSYYENGEMKGILVELCSLIFERSGLKIEFIPTATREDYLEIMKSDTNTIVCDYTDDYASAEAVGYVLTDTYASGSFSQLYRKDYQGGNRVAMVGSSITNSILISDNGEQIIYFKNYEACRDAILRGEADSMKLYTRTAQKYLAEDQTNRLQSEVLPDITVNFAIAVDSDESANLSSILQKAIKGLSEEDTANIMEAYNSNERAPLTLLGLIYEHPVLCLVFVAALFIALLAVLMLLSLRRRRRAEKRSRVELEQALEAAHVASEAKTAFLSRVSHDMRTPLNGILGLAALMRDEIENPAALHDLSQLEVSGQYLRGLINDTLDVSRIESGNLELHYEVCDSHALFDSVITLIKPTIDAKKIHLSTETDSVEYPILYVDTCRVEQIMLNLLGNAAKFTPEGGHITCSIHRLALRDGVVTEEIRVTDDGIGISKEFLPHIFEPFSQEDASKKNTRQGTGLGMVITKQLVEKMGGEITVQSEPGRGTSVRFTLQLALATPEQAGTAKFHCAQPSDESILQGKRVLLCEDHPLNAQIAERLLKKRGVTVERAENGKVGLAMFEEHAAGYYDAVLMDVRMPVMDGLEAAAALRGLQRPDAKTIPILAMTANSFESDVQACLDKGMNAHLSKPVDPMQLYAVLAEYIKKGSETSLFG